MKTTNKQDGIKPAATRLILGCCLALATGCGIVKQKVAETPDEKAEYEYVYTTGSNIPIKIRKGTQRSNEQRTAADQAEVRRLQELQNNPGKPKGN